MKSDSYIKGLLTGIGATMGSIALAAIVVFILFDNIGSENDPISYQDEQIEESSESYKYFLKKEQVILKAIESNYYKEYSEDDLYQGAYKGMLDALNDPYSCYYTAEEMQILNNNHESVYVGIGCSVIPGNNGEIIISKIYDDSPCAKAGIQIEDIIVAVDGQDVVGEDVDMVISRIKGEEGTDVVLTIKRDTVLKDYTLTRAKIQYATVGYDMIDEEIGYIVLAAFYNHSAEEMKKAISELEKRGMKKLIIDLRENPGGTSDSATDMVDIMMGSKQVALYLEKTGGRKTPYYTKDDYALNIPMVILINGQSASAAELFSQAMKDYGKATIIGTQSYGKGVYQEYYMIEDGSGLKLTKGKFYSPNNICVQGVGVTPDIVVEYDRELSIEQGMDNQVQAAIDYLKKN